MTIPKRQRSLGLAALLCAGLFLADRFLLRPVLGWHREQGRQISKLRAEMERAESVLKNRTLYQTRMDEMLRQAPPKDPSAAEQMLLTSLRSWAEQAGISIESMRPRRIVEANHEPELEIRLAARGSLEGLAHMLYDLETAPQPIRLKRTDLSTDKRDRTRLDMALELSMLLVPDGAGTVKDKR